jgi:hypothetical protein
MNAKPGWRVEPATVNWHKREISDDHGMDIIW